MEVSVIGSSQVNVGKVNDTGFCNLSRNLNAKICNAKNKNLKGFIFGQSQNLVWPSRSAIGFSLRASASAQTQAAVSDKDSKITRTKPINDVKLYVGMPLDTVSSSNKINHARAIAAGLKALKLLGVAGVELPVWWGVAENEAMGKYDWTGYLAIVEMVQKLGLEIHVSLCFHASSENKISLPQWVSKIGESEPSIYFTDRSGQQFKDCLSLAADDVKVLDGKSPLEVYKGFFESFKSTFSRFLGSTITVRRFISMVYDVGLTIGLGPDGELRYPSHHHPAKNNSSPIGAGEFQCYDKIMLADLKHHAETHKNPLWGLGGPHDAPSYNQHPISGGFFTENNGSWETPYGDFFLSWYSGRLIRHGDRVLSLAASTFQDSQITLSAKIPLIHTWCKTRSHPSELTGGFYNTVDRDGYQPVVEIFSRNSCGVILPGLDLVDEDQLSEFRSSPESIIAQIMGSCRKHGVEVSGQNSLVSGGFERIKKNLSGGNEMVRLFTYQRMGAYFFSPEHFASFAQFVRGLNEPIRSLDDFVVGDEESVESLSGVIRDEVRLFIYGQNVLVEGYRC
ncbi:inactive beta-amylase 9 [Phtheirospermum japonicum]|uniref:Beta-amylase n=1 Tax=Phtheirospermum japonicum TaxID=374723 RepID=A0A830B2M1_9LAMI|nr:inactive beta-amylase 9 [Phtheirospermum japonicum]